MPTGRLARVAWWGGGAIALCAVLALRDEIAARVMVTLEQRFILTATETTIWQVGYYALWAALVPPIFHLARRVRFRRGSWLRPLVFHLVASAVVAAAAGVALSILFGGLVRGDWPDPTGATIPAWIKLGRFLAIVDSSMYWLILAAGIAVQWYDESRERERQAAALEAALTAAEVDLLKMKLQPHFLFNTLNSIGFLALEGDTDGIVTMVDRLSQLLRSSMQSNGNQLVTVEKEVSLLDQYLAIEEIRFGDRLRVVRCIDPAAVHAMLPSLVLQPIIENSIKHGFSKRIDASRLEIAIRPDGDCLLVTVADDGPGLPRNWDLATHCGRGLRNVIERLDRIFPGAWTFSLSRRPGGGALAELRIPWLQS